MNYVWPDLFKLTVGLDFSLLLTDIVNKNFVHWLLLLKLTLIKEDLVHVQCREFSFTIQIWVYIYHIYTLYSCSKESAFHVLLKLDSSNELEISEFVFWILLFCRHTSSCGNSRSHSFENCDRPNKRSQFSQMRERKKPYIMRAQFLYQIHWFQI